MMVQLTIKPMTRLLTTQQIQLMIRQVTTRPLTTRLLTKTLTTLPTQPMIKPPQSLTQLTIRPPQTLTQLIRTHQWLTQPTT